MTSLFDCNLYGSFARLVHDGFVSAPSSDGEGLDRCKMEPPSEFCQGGDEGLHRVRFEGAKRSFETWSQAFGICFSRSIIRTAICLRFFKRGRTVLVSFR